MKKNHYITKYHGISTILLNIMVFQIITKYVNHHNRISITRLIKIKNLNGSNSTVCVSTLNTCECKCSYAHNTCTYVCRLYIRTYVHSKYCYYYTIG